MKTVTDMAKEAGFELSESVPLWLAREYDLERFAALVREDEREKQQNHSGEAADMVQEPVAWGHPNTMITGKKQALMMVELEIPSNAQYPQLWVPLYTPSLTAAQAARQMRDAAAQKCIELMHKQTTHEAVEAICEVGKAIAALPVANTLMLKAMTPTQQPAAPL